MQDGVNSTPGATTPNQTGVTMDQQRNKHGLIKIAMTDNTYNLFINRRVFIDVKTHYGNKLYYPACDITRVFADIAHTTTLTRDNLDRIKLLGYTIEVKAPKPEEL